MGGNKQKSLGTDQQGRYLSFDGHDTSYNRIYVGMIKSSAYRALSPAERCFLIDCLAQCVSKEGRSVLYKYGEERGQEYDWHRNFVFPAKHLEQFGYDRRNATKYFKALEKAGFIEKVECNSHVFKVNVYSLSTKWRNKGRASPG